MQVSTGSTPPIPPISRGDLLLEKASTLVTRYGQVHSQLTTILQRVGESVDSEPSNDQEEGFGFLGRMDITLRVLYDICDDIERKTEALERSF